MEKSKAGKGWRVRLSHSGVFTGGKVEFSQDGRVFVCSLSENVVVVSSKTGRVLFKLRPGVEDLDAQGIDAGEDEALEKFTTFCLHPSGTDLISASQNQLLRRWSFAELLERKLAEEGNETFKLLPDVSSVLLESSKAEYPTMLRSWKGHEGPITCADFHPSGDLFATGSSDRTVKVWSMKGGFCTHNFSSHRSILSMVKFHPEPNVMRLISGDSSGHVWFWDLIQQTDADKNKTGKSARKHIHLENHVSAITSVGFSHNSVIFTVGRDRVINVWRKSRLLKTFPVMESIEGMQIIPLEFVEKSLEPGADKENIHVIATAGEKSAIKYFCFNFDPAGESHRMYCLKTQQDQGAALVGTARPVHHPFVGLLQATLENKTSLVAIRFDNLIQFYDPITLQRERQIIGYNDEIIDLQYLPKSATHGKRCIAMATNSEHLTVLDLDNFNSELLIGHSDLVLSVDVSRDGKFIATAAKDGTCRVWDVKSHTCIAVCKGHTESVSGVNFLNVPAGIFTRLQPGEGSEEDFVERDAKKRRTDGMDEEEDNFLSKLSAPVLVSVSEDKTLKFWSMRAKSKAHELYCRKTVLAHEKAVNALATAPNKTLVATGALDKVVKLWNVSDGSLRGVLQGHRRGIWHLQFSPVERCLASASGDKTIRIWSISDLSCLTVLEGHSASVLRVQYTHSGQHLLSSSSNGVLKVWTLKNGECISTLEHHTDKVWALAMPPKEQGDDGAVGDEESLKEMVSGGGDSRLVVWRDCSDELSQMELEKVEETLLHEQEMFMSLRRKEYVRAAMRALELNRPFQLRTTLESMIHENNKGQDLKSFVAALNHEQLLKLWELARDWNTYARNSALAQTVVEHLLKCDIPLGAPGKAKTVLDPFRVYSERHFQRVDRLLKDSYLLDHAVACMDNRATISDDH